MEDQYYEYERFELPPQSSLQEDPPPQPVMSWLVDDGLDPAFYRPL